MGLWSPGTGGAIDRITNQTGTGATTIGTAVTSGGSANTYGTVTEIISAANNDRDSWGIEIILTGAGGSATPSAAVCDILVGGATDDVLISSLICGYTYLAGHTRYLFPLHIPAGVRIAAQTSSERTSAPIRVVLNLFGGGVPPWRVGSQVATLGTKVNNSQGVTIAPAASGAAATETQIVASTAEDYFCFQHGFQPHGDSTITPAGNIMTQLGVGDATSDKVGAVKVWHKETTEEWGDMGSTFPVFRPVPAGTRLSIWSSNSGANDGGYDGLIYAVS